MDTRHNLNALLTNNSVIDEILKFFERAFFISKGIVPNHDGAVQNGRPKKE